MSKIKDIKQRPFVEVSHLLERYGKKFLYKFQYSPNRAYNLAINGKHGNLWENLIPRLKYGEVIVFCLNDGIEYPIGISPQIGIPPQINEAYSNSIYWNLSGECVRITSTMGTVREYAEELDTIPNSIGVAKKPSTIEIKSSNGTIILESPSNSDDSKITIDLTSLPSGGKYYIKLK